MADIKFQLFQGTEDRADRRGDLNLGKDTDPVDRHKTLLEYRIPDELGDQAVEAFDIVNAEIAKALASSTTVKVIPEGILDALVGGDGPVRLGFRVYDND